MALRGKEKGINRRTLLVGGGVGVGLVLAWGLLPRSYQPNLRAAPGETLFNAFLKVGRDGRVIVATGSRLLVPQPGIEGLELNFDPAGVWCEMRIEGVRPLER